jgi:hypothetical protein
MIKNYLEFIKETISEIENKHHTLGEWVKDLSLRNKEILELIKTYLEETDSNGQNFQYP